MKQFSSAVVFYKTGAKEITKALERPRDRALGGAMSSNIVKLYHLREECLYELTNCTTYTQGRYPMGVKVARISLYALLEDLSRLGNHAIQLQILVGLADQRDEVKRPMSYFVRGYPCCQGKP